MLNNDKIISIVCKMTGQLHSYMKILLKIGVKICNHEVSEKVKIRPRCVNVFGACGV